jgi:hypothetical protein
LEKSGTGCAGAFKNGDLKEDGAREGFGDNRALGGEEIGFAGVPFSRSVCWQHLPCAIDAHVELLDDFFRREYCARQKTAGSNEGMKRR